MNPNPPPPPPPQSFPVEAPTGWWQRNKKWAIPVGCVGLVIVLGCCGALGFLGWGASKVATYGKQQAAALQSVRQEATVRIQGSPEVIEAVGEPVEVGEPTSPNWRMSNGRVDYNFEIPVNGPKGSITVNGHAGAPDTDTPLRLRELEFDDGQRRVDLMQDEPGE